MPTSADLIAKIKHLHPLMIDLSLVRIRRLLAELGHPEQHLPPVIHIAGTNGKGSTLAFLKAMFEAAGKRVCSYTSPHLVRFHERISLPGPNGLSAPISEDALVDVLSKVLRTNGKQSITYFEITTAAAFLAFKKSKADVALLEVGLGGRFDTTNAINSPALTMITPISMDHTDKLGDTIEKIAFEKAGIIKSKIPVVVAQQTDAAMQVIEKVAMKRDAPLSIWGQNFDIYEQNGRLIYQAEALLMDLPLPSLLGRHQIRNAGLAIAAILRLRDLKPELPDLILNDNAIEEGLTTATWPARLQRITDGPLVGTLGDDSELWLDGGHNEAAGQALAQAVADLEDRASKPLLLIIGMMQGKDANGFLAPFRGLASKITAVPIGSIENDMGDSARQAVALAKLASKMGFDAGHAQSLEQAVTTAQAKTEGSVRILICGSLYLAGQALALGV